jgi:hypothetical protein
VTATGRCGGPLRARGGSVRDPLPLPGLPVAPDGEEVFCNLTDLPVTVGQAGSQGRFGARVVEGGQCSGGPAADRRLVVEGGNDRVESGGVPDGTQGGDGRLPAERIAVSGEPVGEGDEQGYGDRVCPFAQSPRRHLDNHRGLVGQRPVECDARSEGSQLRCPSPHRGLGVFEGTGDDTVVQRAQTIEGTECGFAYRRTRVRHPCAGGHLVAQVSGDDDGTPALGETAVEGLSGELTVERFRGRLWLPRSAGLPPAVTRPRPVRRRFLFGARSRHHITMTER